MNEKTITSRCSGPLPRAKYLTGKESSPDSQPSGDFLAKQQTKPYAINDPVDDYGWNSLMNACESGDTSKQ
jgi:hypothetical protein